MYRIDRKLALRGFYSKAKLEIISDQVFRVEKFLFRVTVKLSNLNKFPNRTEPNSVELIQFCHGEPSTRNFPNF
jgi:hypothetical protein